MKTMQNDRRCETCLFWEDDEMELEPTPREIVPGTGLIVLEKYGLCRRYPPNPNPPEGQHGWPVTDYKDWCGEWESR